jgi:hypothetical protein
MWCTRCSRRSGREGARHEPGAAKLAEEQVMRLQPASAPQVLPPAEARRFPP